MTENVNKRKNNKNVKPVDGVRVGEEPAPGVRLRCICRGHKGTLGRVAWSPCGQYIASPSIDKTIGIWDAETGSLVANLKGHSEGVFDVAWSPGGDLLASASNDCTARVWEVQTKANVAILNGHSLPVYSVAWSPDGLTLALSSRDKTVSLWNSNNWQLQDTLEGHSQAVEHVSWSPEGEMLASCSWDKTVCLWNSSGELLKVLTGSSGMLFGLAWDKSMHIAAAGEDTCIHIWDVKTGKRESILEGHSNWVKHVSYSADGTLLASKGNADSNIRIWRADTISPLVSFSETSSDGVPSGIEFSPSECHLATLGEGDRSLRIWDLDKKLLLSQRANVERWTQTAKIVLVGESNVGKSCLAMRLAEDRYPDNHEHGTNHGVRFWPMEAEELYPAAKPPEGQRRDVLLWDFGGQDEYQLVHQMFLHDTTLALVLIDPTRGQAALDEARDWNKRLEKYLGEDRSVKLLVGAKVDQKRELIDQNSIDALCTEFGFTSFLDLSAKTGRNTKRLRKLISDALNWDQITKISRTKLFQQIHDDIERRRKQGEVFVSAVEFQNVIVHGYYGERLDRSTSIHAIDAVVEQLAKQGVIVKTLPEDGEEGIVFQLPVIERYAGSVIIAARGQDGELDENDVLGPKPVLPGIRLQDRIPRQTELVVLKCVVRLMAEYSICIRDGERLVFPQLMEVGKKEDIHADLLKRARQTLADGDYATSRRQFVEVINSNPESAKFLKSELGFVFDFDTDEDSDRSRWERNRGQIEWRRKTWAVLAHHDIELFESKPSKDSPDDDEVEPNKKKAKKETRRSRPVVKGMTSEAKGEALERATLRLLGLLFPLDELEDEQQLEELSQQLRGEQFGYDLKLRYFDREANREVRCFIECKSQDSAITLDTVAGKVEALALMQSQPDHWILIAPRAKAANKLKPALDKWHDEERYAFKIHVWTQGTLVEQLFGLVPELHDLWFEDFEFDSPHPSEWSSNERNALIKVWKRKLSLPLRLPPGWKTYVNNRKKWRIFSDESDDNLMRLCDENIAPRCLDETGAPLPEDFFSTVLTWLESSTRGMILLGDYGDGKTIATYLLTARLVRQFRLNPQGAWLPLRCSLRDFSRPGIGGGRDFLRRRVEEFGANIDGWKDLVEKHKVFVILDGIDEMTTSLTSVRVQLAVDSLVDCCQAEFLDQKLLLTCRTPFFQTFHERDYLLDALDNPLVVTLKNFERRSVIDHFAEKATTPERRRRLHSLRTMHDPIGLATKPLFFKWVSETLWDEDTDCTSLISLYESYIRKSLKRKAELLQEESPSSGRAIRSARVGRDKLIERMEEILESVAIEIHHGRQEFACLRRIGQELPHSEYAEVLWQRANADGLVQEDATHRVGIRSLLRRVEIPGQDITDKVWPVDFCHRSVREFFVARRIVRVVIENVSTARETLANTDLSIEIVHFAASMMKRMAQSLFHPVLRSFAEQSGLDSDATKLSDDQRACLGKNAITLLFKAEGKLAESEWNNMILDGADLSGVDLSGKNFKGTSLRKAILDNAVFKDADFSDSDLTGVRLEETAEVRSLSVLPGSDRFLVLYDDGRVIEWTLKSTSRRQYHVTFEIPGGGTRCLANAVPGSDLALQHGNQLLFADYKDGHHQRVAEIRMRPEVSRVVLRQDMLVIVDEDGGSYYVSGFPSDVSANDFMRWPIGSAWICDYFCDESGQVLIVVNPEKGVALQHLDKRLAEKLLPETHGTTAVTVSKSTNSKDDFLIACGNQIGQLKVFKCTMGKQIDFCELYSCMPHRSAITSIAILDDESVLTGGLDRRIVRTMLRSNLPETSQVFQSQLQCEGMKVTGLHGIREKNILLGLGAVEP